VVVFPPTRTGRKIFSFVENWRFKEGWSGSGAAFTGGTETGSFAVLPGTGSGGANAGGSNGQHFGSQECGDGV
jgi:hypothetical protein